MQSASPALTWAEKITVTDRGQTSRLTSKSTRRRRGSVLNHWLVHQLALRVIPILMLANRPTPTCLQSLQLHG